MFLCKGRNKVYTNNEVSESHMRHIEIKELSSLLKTETLNDTIGLAINIRFFGILNPLNVYYDKKDQKYYVINGYEKLAALCLLGRTRVYCNVITDQVTCDGIIIEEYILKPNRDMFRACTALSYLTNSRGYGINKISTMTGLPTSTISNFLKINCFSPEEKRMISLLDVDEGTCIELAKIDDPIARGNVLHHIREQKVNIKNVCEKQNRSAQFAFDGGIITNSVNQLVSKLTVMGISSKLKSTENDDSIIYTITVARPTVKQ